MSGICSAHTNMEPGCVACHSGVEDIFPDYEEKLKEAEAAGLTYCAECGFEYYRTVDACPLCVARMESKDMLDVYTAPTAVPYHMHQTTKPRLFLAGGITGCPDWQGDVIACIQNRADNPIFQTPHGLVLNPRRPNFPISDPLSSYEQIAWEIFAMKQADVIAFWFPKETLCPITLFEYGRQLEGVKQLIVGVHPEYARRRDVEIQTQILRPDIKVGTDFLQFVNEVQRLFDRRR